MTSKKRSVFILFVTFAIAVFSIAAMGQTAAPAVKPAEAAELHAGVELGIDGVKAVVMRVSQYDESRGITLVHSDVIPMSQVSQDGVAFDPRKTGELVSILQKLMARFRDEYRIPGERIHLIGSGGIWASLPAEVAESITSATGKKLVPLEMATEVELSIAGTVPRREKIGEAWVDVRNSSVLVEIGNTVTRGGYQILKYRPPARPGYEFATMSIPYGTTNLANEISHVMGDNNNLLDFIRRISTSGAASFKQSLRKERENKPGLLVRNRVYLSGEIVRAMATLLFPEERQNFVPLTAEDITTFARKAFYDPVALLNPSLSKIRDRELRQEVERELKSVRDYFTPQQIVAGAEMLKTLSAELNLREKDLRFARHGDLSRILTYVRLQAEK